MNITVVGSINTDFVVKVKSMVSPGETILAQESHYFPGGKGANQALACARLGGKTTFVGKLGNDAHAKTALSLLEKSTCQLNISRLNEADTGLAIILLDEHGENSIIVSPGANHVWHESDEDIATILKGSDILVLQLEIPVDVVKRFLIAAKRLGIKTVLNPSPVTAEIRDALALVDVLLMNKTEATFFTAEQAASTKAYAKQIKSLGAAETIVTLGAEGALLFQHDDVTHVGAQAVDVVDTTAAGDTYTGALVAKLANGHDLQSAAVYASYAAAIAVGTIGAQPSIPEQSVVDSVFNMSRE